MLPKDINVDEGSSSSCSAKKKEADLASAVSRANSLEGQLHKSEAALSTALSQSAALTSELGEVKSLLAKVGTGWVSVYESELLLAVPSLLPSYNCPSPF